MANLRVDLNGNSDFAVDSVQKAEKKEQNGNRIFAGKTSKDTESLIEQKRSLARKQAFRIVSDAWEKDKSLTDSISSMEQTKAQKAAELRELESQVNNIKDKKDALMKEYGVSPDSQEQKDLELLERYQNYKNGASYEPFNKEEIERLKQLQNEDRTEYQKRVLQLNDANGSFSIKAEKLKSEIIGLTQSVTDTKSEQNKSQSMLKAQNASDVIIGAAEDEIMGEILKDGMENIDKKFEEEKKKAEEAADKKQEKEENLEEQKAERKEQQELIENKMKSDRMEQDSSVQNKYETSVESAQKTVQQILEDNNMIDEDLKGIQIDFEF